MADALYQETANNYGRYGRALLSTTRVAAMIGGLILILMSLMMLASIIGRTIGIPLVGDYELVQLMSAVAISLFLPFCQMSRGHVIVEFFTMKCPTWLNRILDVFSNLLLTFFALLFCWRIWLGLIELFGNGNASMMLGIPTWIGYIPMFASFLLFGLAGLYSAWAIAKGVE